MANHASALKRNRQRIIRTVRNRALRSSLRSALKQARLALESGDAALAASKASEAKQALARAASKGVIHSNNASRRTSRIDHALARLAQG
jgi:small subunit ribosomal protein S20